MNEKIRIRPKCVSQSEKTITLGKQGENGSRSVVFDFSEWISEFGEGTVTLYNRREGDDSAYPVIPEVDGIHAVWRISSTDTAKSGNGTVEVRYSVGDTVVKSETYPTYVYPSNEDGASPAPDPYESWVETLVMLGDTVRGYAEDAEDAKDSAEAAAETYPYIRMSDKHWMVWDTESGEYADTGVVAEGSGGSSDHTLLSNRDASDQHPISAVTGLQTALDGKQPKNITDAGGYYVSDTVEGALAEIGAEIAGINTLLGSGVIE